MLPGDGLALLLVNISRLHNGLLLTHLVRNQATLLTRLLNIITNLQGDKGLIMTELYNECIYLLGDLVSDLAAGALAVSDVAALGPGHEGAL